MHRLSPSIASLQRFGRSSSFVSRSLRRALAIPIGAVLLSVQPAGNTALAQSSGLVAAYSFEAGSGTTLADVTGQSNTVTLSGPTWSGGRYGGALSYDGSNDAGVANSANSALSLTGRSFTLSAWINPRSNSGWQMIVNKPYTSGHSAPYFDWSMHRENSTGRLVAFLGCDGQQRASNTSIPLNVWTHVAVTYDGTSLRHYINGNLDRTTSLSCSVTNTHSRPIRIGANGAGTEVMNGSIDDLRIYNRPQSASEIQADVATALGGSAPPPQDNVAPSVSISSPSGGATVSGTVTVSANASDNVGVTGVQFRIDGANVGSEDRTAPYSVSWSTTQVANGNHNVLAIARDAAGNTTTSAAVNVNVNNASAPPPPSSSGPLAAYAFDAASGTTLADVSGNSNTINLLNGPTWTTGHFGRALSFDGSNDMGVATSANPAMNLTGNRFTLSAWINQRSRNGWQIIVNKPYSAGHGWPFFEWSMHIESYTGKLVAYLGCDAQQHISNGSVPLNTWTHVAVTYDGASIRHYINGVLDRTTGMSCSISNANSRPIRIGANGAGVENFNGLIDDVRIYNRVLSTSEVQTDMNTALQDGSAPPQNPPPTLSLSASPTTVPSGGSSNLSWNSTEASACVASGSWSGQRPTSGTASTGSLSSPSNTFTLECSGTGGSVVKSATVAAQQSSGTKYGLDFPGAAATTGTIRFRFSNPLAQYPATYIWKVYPRSQPHYYTTFFWGNDGEFWWHNGHPDSYYGAHPYPYPAPNHVPPEDVGPRYWEISVDGLDVLSPTTVEYNRWHTQALRVWSDGSGKHHEFYWDLPDTSKVIRYTASTSYGEVRPPSPALTFGDAPWAPSKEILHGILRGIQVYNTTLSVSQILTEANQPLSTSQGANSIWYLNLNPTPSDISDKSGRGHHPAWVGSERPTLWQE